MHTTPTITTTVDVLPGIQPVGPVMSTARIEDRPR